MKKRLDQILVEKKFFDTRSRAQAAISLGDIFVDGQKVDKAGAQISQNSKIENRGKINKYVGRGGLKLEEALKEYQINVKDKVCLDVGASTGGFTDCLLKNGAKNVYALDVGYGQIDWKLRTDPRVVVIERQNIRDFNSDRLFDLATIDVSFISLTKVLPNVSNLLKNNGEIIALIKPQFEAKRAEVGKGGIVKDEAVHAGIIEKISVFAKELGLYPKRVVPSPITGADGNKEFLIWITKQE